MSITVSDDVELLTVFKSCGNYIVTLKIDPLKDNNLSRKACDKRYAGYRCRRAYVVSIVNKDDENQTLDSIESDYTKAYGNYLGISSLVYEVNRWFTISNYHPNVSKVDASGIHFYTTREAAWHHRKDEFVSPNFTGSVKYWENDDGILSLINEYRKGIIYKAIKYKQDYDENVSEETEFNEYGKELKKISYFPDGRQRVTYYYHDGTKETFTLPLQSVQPNPLYGKSTISSANQSSRVIPSGLSSTTPMVVTSGFGLRASPMVPYVIGVQVKNIN
jgi:hypothetical protein